MVFNQVQLKENKLKDLVYSSSSDGHSSHGLFDDTVYELLDFVSFLEYVPSVKQVKQYVQEIGSKGSRTTTMKGSRCIILNDQLAVTFIVEKSRGITRFSLIHSRKLK